MKTLRFGILFLLAGILMAACASASGSIITKEYVLTTDLREGRLIFLGVSDEINGQENPTLSANPGDTITITLINGGMGQHNITLPVVKANSGVVKEKGEATSVTFRVPGNVAQLEYLDGIGNHAELGMRGILQVIGVQAADASEPSNISSNPPIQNSSNTSNPEVLAAFQKGACGSCHTIAGIPNAQGLVGPDLSHVTEEAQHALDSGDYSGSAKTTEEFIHESILSPDAFVASTCPTGPCPAGVMPVALAQTLTESELSAIVGYLGSLPAGAYTESSAPSAAPVAPVAPATGADIVRAPTDLPAPIGVREPTTIRIDLEAVEIEGQLADGTTYTYWTFNGAVPGPFFRVKLGDTLEVHMKNSTSSTMNHSVDFHAVTGPGGGATMTQTKPGEETMFTAKAINPGLFVYHCATPMVASHIANGMYGLILVEPEGGLPPVDREFYVMQGELYTTGAFGEHGHQAEDTSKLLNEDPEYLVFNGAVGAITDQKPLTANVGETVRIFFGVGGPNFTSSFHVIGEIFDRVYDQASLTSAPLTDVQTTLVPPGGATMVEFKLEVPGRYILVDHALSRLQRGLAGYLVVEGAENPDIFQGTPSGDSGH